MLTERILGISGADAFVKSSNGGTRVYIQYLNLNDGVEFSLRHIDFQNREKAFKGLANRILFETSLGTTLGLASLAVCFAGLSRAVSGNSEDALGGLLLLTDGIIGLRTAIGLLNWAHAHSIAEDKVINGL